jgi:LysM repeat protein/predicted esterase
MPDLLPRTIFAAIAVFSGVLTPMSATADSGSAEEAPAVAVPEAKPPTAPMTEDEAAPPDESEPGPSDAQGALPPAETAAPATPPKPEKEPPRPVRPEHGEREHVVASGETLGGIAHHYGIFTDALATANGITRLTPIRAGQKLVVPAPGETVHAPARTHVVGRGNTIGGISRRYGVTIEALLAANHLRRTDRLKIGQRLGIPGDNGAMPVHEHETVATHAEETLVHDSGMQELPIQGSAPAYYFEPTGAGRSGMRPVIVYLHGRGADPKYYCKRWSHVARDLGWLICPSGQEDRGDGKRGWGNSWPGGRNVVMRAIEGLRTKYGRRVQLYGNTLIGFSEGAFVAMNVGLREPHTFNRWLILGADTDYWGAAGVATLPEAKGRVRRVYLITGGHDDVVDDAAKVRRWLTDAGVPVRVTTPRDMGHEVALETKPGMYQAALRWLAQG